jgi:hypothetical protein
MTTLLDSRLGFHAPRTFGHGLLAPARRPRPAGPSATDAAWWAGFTLGAAHESADPSSDLSPAEAAAWAAGFDAGWDSTAPRFAD